MTFLLPHKKNIFYILLLWTPYICIYQITNRCHFFPVHALPMTRMDQAVPFLPFMIPVYISYLFYVFWSIYRVKTPRAFTDIFILSHFQTCISALFFIFFPVYYPEASFKGTGIPWEPVAAFWAWFDEPFNCFPSLHTANTLLAMHFNRYKKFRAFHLIWGGLIIASTVLCKRHYLVDIAGGTGVYLLTIYVARHADISLKDKKAP